MTRFALLALALAGCLSVPEPPKPVCTTTADCNSGAGEVCEEGICWGDPPSGIYAATLAPPSERNDDLVPIEIPLIDLPRDGWLGDLAFAQPITFSGRIEAFCTAPIDCGGRLSVDADIVITRPSTFPGGPGFVRKIGSEGDLENESFHVALPPITDGDAPYTITVIPANRNSPSATVSLAEVVPPLRMTLPVGESLTGKSIVLGEGTATLDGKVSLAGSGVANYRVVALGRWEAGAPATEVSSVGYTGIDGRFQIALSNDLVGAIELVARPVEDVTKPTLRIGGIAANGGTQNLALPQNLGTLRTVPVHVTGPDAGGKVGPVSGARVIVHAQIEPAVGSLLNTRVVSETQTDEDGNAIVQMFDGAAVEGAYRLRIVPAPGAIVGAVYDEPVAIAPTIEKQLVDRIAVSGVVTDQGGTPLGGIAITVHPALRFAWSLPEAAQAFLAEIPAASTVSTNNGGFVVYVDPIVAGTWGSYALVFEQASPNDTSQNRSSNWRVDDIQMPRDLGQKAAMLDPIKLPDAAYLHGRIVDVDGLELEGAELKLFRIEAPSYNLCAEVQHAPPSCPIPAHLQGRGSTDATGTVRLSLPRQ